jgi:hypothetical protein
MASIYLSPKTLQCLHYAIIREESANDKLSISDFLRSLSNGLLDRGIPFCCIAQFCVQGFLTGKNQAKSRGMVFMKDYYAPNIGNGFIPCFWHKSHFNSEKSNGE